MSGEDSLIVYAVASAELFLSLMVNGFITVINLMDRCAGKKLKPFDKIFLSLGISRLIHTCLCIFNLINRVCRLSVYDIDVLNWMMNTLYLFLDFSSLWLAMWLCFLYYVKVVIFKSTILIRLKLRIPQIVLYMILSSVFISFFSGFVFAYNYDERFDIMYPAKQQTTSSNSSIGKQMLYMVPSYFFGHFLPFICVSVSSSLLIEALLVHVKSIKSSITSFTPPRMDAHISAIRSVFLVEFTTIIYLISTILLRFDCHGSFYKSIIFIFVISYPTFHSLVLIMGNSKLKKALDRLFHNVKKCDKIRHYCIKTQKDVHVNTTTQQHAKV